MPIICKAVNKSGKNLFLQRSDHYFQSALHLHQVHGTSLLEAGGRWWVGRD